MENQKTKQKRSFKYVIRFFQIIFAIIFVFLASFFITLSLHAEKPTEHFFSVLKEVRELFSDDAKKSEVTKYSSTASANLDSSFSIEKNSSSRTAEKISSPIVHENQKLGLNGKIDRIQNVEKAVKEKEKNIRPYVMLEDIPNSLVQAIVAVEDARFYSHEGYDITSIARAAFVNVEAGEIEEGGSTITQQLAKNLFLSQEQSFTRKIEELLLARNIEKHFSKRKILELYLNTIYFGSNFYGISAAAEGYFGKKPKELTVAESAMLAGLPNAPSLYSPYVNFMLAKKRQLVVIDAMLKNKYISQKDAESARIEEIVLVRE